MLDVAKQRTIAVDFDGTIVEDNYPSIGRPRTFAFDTLKRLQNDGHRLILWTYRSGKHLDEAVDFCRKNGIEFYAVNKNYPEEEFTEQTIRKLHVDFYIDDRIVGGFPGWGKIYQILNPNAGGPAQPIVPPKRKGFFGFGRK
ncbi:MAG: hydrolase [Chitinophagaceae bacterium]|nr:hydrolase [Chitinophagaceae bacterium]